MFVGSLGSEAYPVVVQDTGTPAPEGVLGVLTKGKGSITFLALPNTSTDWAVEAVGVHSQPHQGLVR